MAIFVVLAPPQDDRGAIGHAERILFVRDGFSWRAFAFGPLWMLRHRLWLALFLYVLVIGALIAAISVAHITEGFSFVFAFLIAILIGLESMTLRRWTLLRRRWRDLGIVAGSDAEDAERRFFDHWVTEMPVERAPESTAAATSPYVAMRDRGSDIIGLFPEPGAQR